MLIATALLGWPAAHVFAHGSWPPKHGGIMSYYEDEVSFELVSQADGWYFFASDHGLPLSASGAQAAIWIENPNRDPGEPNERQYDLTAMGDYFVLKDVVLDAKTRLAIRVTFPNAVVGQGGFDFARQGVPAGKMADTAAQVIDSRHLGHSSKYQMTGRHSGPQPGLSQQNP